VLIQPTNEFGVVQFGFLEVCNQFGSLEDTTNCKLILVCWVVGLGVDKEKLFKFILLSWKDIVVWMKGCLVVKSYEGEVRAGALHGGKEVFYGGCYVNFSTIFCGFFKNDTEQCLSQNY